MRNIKFRGLDKNGKFVYGNLIQTKDLDGDCSSWIQEKSFLGLGVLSTPTSSFTSVDSKTVGQFIGVTDIDGGEIFSNDILHKLDPVSFNPILVSYSDFLAGFCVNCGDIGFDVVISDDYININELIIIGNKHQDEELLKGDK